MVKIKSVVFPKEIATFNDGILFESSLDAISIVEAVKRQSIPGSITQVRKFCFSIPRLILTKVGRGSKKALGVLTRLLPMG